MFIETSRDGACGDTVPQTSGLTMCSVSFFSAFLLNILDDLAYFGLYKFVLRMEMDLMLKTSVAKRYMEVDREETVTMDRLHRYEFTSGKVHGLEEE